MISVLEVFAILPTMRKSWHHPNEETASIYIVSAITQLLSLGSIGSLQPPHRYISDCPCRHKRRRFCRIARSPSRNAC
jgi:hypothetical protein